jgi:CAAX prenyl protease-like protein
MSALSPFVSIRPSPAFARIAPFALFIVLLAIESLIGDRAGDLRWLTVLRAFLVAGALALLWRHYEELHRFPRVALRHWALAIGLGIATTLAWIVLDRGWAVLGAPKGFAPLDAAGRVDPTLALLRLVGFALVVPVMEELFWRSYLLRRIVSHDFLAVDPRTAGFAAFALSSALFASEHSFGQAGLLAGAAYNVCFMRSRNLWVAILAHAITNGTLGIWILATGSWRYW